jgi:hypothetical protein
MQMAQIVQRGLVFFAHPAREVRITQPLIARIFWHVLQHAQPLPDGLSAIRRHLPPFRCDLVPNVILLLRRQPIPVFNARLEFLALCGRKVLHPPIVFNNPLFFLRAQLVELSRRRVRRRWPIPIVRLRCRSRAIHVRVRRTIPARILLLRLSLRLLLCLSLLLLRRFRRPIGLLILHPMYPRSLRKARYSHRSTHSQRQQPPRELELPSHLSLHLLIRIRSLILIHIINVIALRWLRQVAQRSKIRNHIVIFQH